MLMIEDVKEEYFRVSKLLKKEAVSTTEYAAYVKDGYSAHYIKRDLGLTYSEMKKIIGAKAATSANSRGGQKKSPKIICNRDGSMMPRNECIPGCNDACIPCKNKQLGNIKAGDDTLTYEQEKLMRHGLRGMDYIALIEPHAEI